MVDHTQKQCKNIDHYKCTWEEDHKEGKHSVMMAYPLWWCLACIVEMERDKLKTLVEKIIGQDEAFVHDRQTASCMCHPPEQLWFMVKERNKVRADQRKQLEELLK